MEEKLKMWVCNHTIPGQSSAIVCKSQALPGLLLLWTLQCSHKVQNPNKWKATDSLTLLKSKSQYDLRKIWTGKLFLNIYQEDKEARHSSSTKLLPSFLSTQILYLLPWATTIEVDKSKFIGSYHQLHPATYSRAPLAVFAFYFFHDNLFGASITWTSAKR